MTFQDFKIELDLLVAKGIKTHGVGYVTADLQVAAANLLSQSDDIEFKKLAVKRFAERAGV